MQTADFNVDDFDASSQAQADKGLLVKFFLKPREDKAESLKQSRPVFRDTEYIDIKIPGNRGSGACRPATDGDKQRFREHYKAFKDRTTVDQDMGTPLIEWPVISRSLAEELAFFHVKTVEQLSTMADTQVSKFMGLYATREKAKVWLQSTKKDKPLFDMDNRLKAQDEEIADLKESLAMLIKQVTNPDPDLNEKQKATQLKRAMKGALEKVA